MNDVSNLVPTQDFRLGVIAAEILPLVSEEPGKLYAAEICRRLNDARGPHYTHELDVGKALKQLEARHLLTSTMIRHPQNGQKGRLYFPTFDTGLALGLYLLPKEKEAGEDEILSEAFVDFNLSDASEANWHSIVPNRLATILRDAGIITTSDLTAQKEKRIHAMKYIGAARKSFLKAFMATRGFQFAT